MNALGEEQSALVEVPRSQQRPMAKRIEDYVDAFGIH